MQFREAKFQKSIRGALGGLWLLATVAGAANSPFLQVRVASDGPTSDAVRMAVFERTSTGKPDILFVRKPILMDEGSVAGVSMSMDQATHQGMVQLQLNVVGRKRLAEITRRNIGHRLAIVLDGQLYCAPVITQEMNGGAMMITDGFSHDQASALAAKISEHLRWDDPTHVSAPEKAAKPTLNAGEPSPRVAVVPPSRAEDATAMHTRAAIISRWPILAPQVVWTRPVRGPVAVKAMADGSVYVLSDRPPTLQWLGSNGTVRASFKLTQFHPAPLIASGFDVDDKSNVYVAMTSLNEVLMLRPTGNGSYTPTVVFENGPELALRSPQDVAVTPDGSSIYVSDSGNHRVARLMHPWNATFIKGFSEPRGLCLDAMGEAMVADTGKGGVFSVLDNNIFDGFSCPGVLKASATPEVIYVTDGTTVKQYDSEAHVVLREIPASLGLKNPRSVSAWPVGFEQRVYIADYGNNRVVGVTFSRPDPIVVWNEMKKAVADGDIPRALRCFSDDGLEHYKAEFQTMTPAELAKILNRTTHVTLVSMSDSFAACAAISPVDGKQILFYINFSNNNGAWKIDSF